MSHQAFFAAWERQGESLKLENAIGSPLIRPNVVPLALAANIFRVIATVQLVDTWGVEFAQGILHETFSLGTYIIGTLAVIGVARILR